MRKTKTAKNRKDTQRRPRLKRGRRPKPKNQLQFLPENPELEYIFLQHDPKEFEMVSFDPERLTPRNNTIFQADPVLGNGANNKLNLFESSFAVNIFGYWLMVSQNILTNILYMSPKELNVNLAQFVIDVKKPNGDDFTPDTIYYLCLGIQKYLLENGSQENIFYDLAYQDFQNSLEIVALAFQILYTYPATTIEENHLWDTKQLGDHSPQALINTIIFLFTKNCHLMVPITEVSYRLKLHFDSRENGAEFEISTKMANVQSHMGLSLRQITQEFSRNNRNCVTIMSCPVDSDATFQKDAHILKKSDNRLRCPVRLCRLYLAKCPIDTKSYETIFYLQPENHYSTENSLWFKTFPLLPEVIERALNLFRMIKEIRDIFHSDVF